MMDHEFLISFNCKSINYIVIKTCDYYKTNFQGHYNYKKMEDRWPYIIIIIFKTINVRLF